MTDHLLDFETWMELVDDACERIAGVSIYDLPDNVFYDLYEDGYTPAEAAKNTLTEAGW